MEEEEVYVVGVDTCVFPSLHIITYCDAEQCEAVRSAVTQTGMKWVTSFPTWSAHKGVFVTYGWHLEQMCPVRGQNATWIIVGWFMCCMCK